MTESTVPAWDDELVEELARGQASGMSLENHYGRKVVVVDYEKYVRKGQKLTQYLDMTAAPLRTALVAEGKIPTDATCQSQFTQHSMMATCGWLAQAEHHYTVPGLESALNGLGKLASALDTNKTKLIEMQQSEPYTHAGLQWEATNANYQGLYCPTEGLIISTDEFGPRHRILSAWPWSQEAAQNRAPEPPLTHWSDVMFLTYENLSSSLNCRTRDLKHIIRDNVDNSASHNVIEIAMKKKYDALFPAPTWKNRHVFYAGEEGAKAILATPNARGVAWLLLTHRAQLGHKRIRSIAVFERDEAQDDKTYGPSLYFELEEVPLGNVP